MLYVKTSLGYCLGASRETFKKAHFGDFLWNVTQLNHWPIYTSIQSHEAQIVQNFKFCVSISMYMLCILYKETFRRIFKIF
jgi:hypothetical protein